MRKNIRVMLAGVGGQGTILAARIISEAAAYAGMDVKMAEIHGMSQRGGSVVSQVVFGTDICSPVPEVGTVDYLAAFEKLEGLRQSHFLSPNGLLLLNNREIMPMPVLNGKAEFPQDIPGTLSRLGIQFKEIEAASAAEKLGMPQVQNLVIVGALSVQAGLRDFPWDNTIDKLVKPQFRAINREAFALGRQLGE